MPKRRREQIIMDILRELNRWPMGCTLEMLHTKIGGFNNFMTAFHIFGSLYQNGLVKVRKFKNSGTLIYLAKYWIENDTVKEEQEFYGFDEYGREIKRNETAPSGGQVVQKDSGTNALQRDESILPSE